MATRTRGWRFEDDDLLVARFMEYPRYALIRPHPKRVRALKGLNILAQGNALGTMETNT